AYTDTLIAYFAPRACLALDLGCDLSDYIITNTKGDFLQKDAVGLNISPNPATNEAVFSTFRNFPMQDVLLYDAQGRLVNNWFEINDNHFTLKRGEMPAGMYIARIRFEEGTVAAKVIFK
ncbi:MAG TPA: T9SS type A sorting domain-containing protein, partial [Phaeodactylibacter sp.]|nr:T9SS type A sorting domain-containing protein [Phaeodactylibacter sp.]